MWWSKDSPKHLPASTGPFLPGCTDVMLDYDENGLLMRLYYPINDQEKQQSNKWIPWLQDYHYRDGMAKVLKFPNIFLKAGFWWSDNVHIPVQYGQIPKIPNNKLKCVIVSHGMGGSKFFYSKMCYDLASYGYLVICPEHRDKSASYTYFYKSKEDAQKDNRTTVQFEHYPFGDKHYQKRREQMQIRSKECAKLIDFLKNLNEGIIPHNVLEDVKSYEKTPFKLDDLVGNIDVHDFTIVGHSFGGASALQVTSEREDIGRCILLDPWMYPIKNENLDSIIKVPILFVNTQTFHIGANVKMMEKFLSNENSKMYTLRGTTHENQADTVLIFGSWLNLFIRKIEPKLGFQINDSLILEFLHDRLNLSSDIEEIRTFLRENKDWFEEGLTKPWA
ncbi:unnamed protein product [Phaedon cochleariae]|uniref:1-alkyl-2-acetylglycerophosphocholine esterase n=1 Tax=Phaedon cochleariae TaxID=80249 RepID=A0A9P0DHB1_PHACE|nr:unnamed protein product [Phaedon cochleariae]